MILSTYNMFPLSFLKYGVLLIRHTGTACNFVHVCKSVHVGVGRQVLTCLFN